MCEHKQPYEMVGDKVCQSRFIIPLTLQLSYHTEPFLIPEISEAPSKNKVFP